MPLKIVINPRNKVATFLIKTKNLIVIKLTLSHETNHLLDKYIQRSILKNNYKPTFNNIANPIDQAINIPECVIAAGVGFIIVD